MESYGALLKKARENKRLTIEAVERDIRITREYIIGLEEEDSSAFPGEPYLIGFLKNYSDYLGVDSNTVLNLYNAKKIQESPVPEELLAHHAPKFILPLIICVLVALLAGAAFYLYFYVIDVPKLREERAASMTETAKIHQYEFSGQTENHRLYKGDQILLPVKSGNGNIVLTVSNTLGVLTLDTPVGSQVIDLSEERELDVDGDGKAEMILYLSDISQSDASRGAEVRMLLKDPDSIKNYLTAGLTTDESEIPTVASSSDSKQVIILEDTRAYPFTMNVSFRGSCVFRYRIDNNTNVEDYYKSGDVISVTARNGIRVWTSNINAMKIQVIADTATYDLEVGKAGQVKVQDIKWVRDSDGKYRLAVIELD